MDLVGVFFTRGGRGAIQLVNLQLRFCGYT